MNMCADMFQLLSWETVCTTQLGLNTIVTIVCLACYILALLKNLENPKWNCIILPILEDTVPPALQMMK